MRTSAVAIALVVAIALDSEARANDSRFWPNDIRTLFGVAKNTNRNVVEYGIHLDKECMPMGARPIFAYWRDHEKGPEATSDLDGIDTSVYGIRSQSVVKRTPDESRVLVTLKAAKDRTISVTVKKHDGRCVDYSSAVIAGKPARLHQVFVHVAGLLSVDWIEIRGFIDGKPVVERVKH